VAVPLTEPSIKGLMRFVCTLKLLRAGERFCTNEVFDAKTSRAGENPEGRRTGYDASGSYN